MYRMMFRGFIWFLFSLILVTCSVVDLDSQALHMAGPNAYTAGHGAPFGSLPGQNQGMSMPYPQQRRVFHNTLSRIQPRKYRNTFFQPGS